MVEVVGMDGTKLKVELTAEGKATVKKAGAVMIGAAHAGCGTDCNMPGAM